MAEHQFRVSRSEFREDRKAENTARTVMRKSECGMENQNNRKQKAESRKGEKPMARRSNVPMFEL
jgi:hypothetical protein